MSDSVREWRFYVDDMIGFAEKALAYTAGLDQGAFIANALVYAPPCATWSSSARLQRMFPTTCGRPTRTCPGAGSSPRATV
jgi:hypothetical protein